MGTPKSLLILVNNIKPNSKMKTTDTPKNETEAPVIDVDTVQVSEVEEKILEGSSPMEDVEETINDAVSGNDPEVKAKKSKDRVSIRQRFRNLSTAIHTRVRQNFSAAQRKLQRAKGKIIGWSAASAVVVLGYCFVVMATALHHESKPLFSRAVTHNSVEGRASYWLDRTTKERTAAKKAKAFGSALIYEEKPNIFQHTGATISRWFD